MSERKTVTLNERLRLHRLDNAWTFQRLSEEIFAATGVRISAPTLSRFVDNESEIETSEIYVHQISRYLDAVKAA